jgi:hypothetical protein
MGTQTGLVFEKRRAEKGADNVALAQTGCEEGTLLKGYMFGTELSLMLRVPSGCIGALFRAQ